MLCTTGRRAAWAAGLLCLLGLASCAPPPAGSADLAYPVGDFTLTDQDGREVHAADLAGKVWVASFIFTRCGGPCPRVTATMPRQPLCSVPPAISRQASARASRCSWSHVTV